MHCVPHANICTSSSIMAIPSNAALTTTTKVHCILHFHKMSFNILSISDVTSCFLDKCHRQYSHNLLCCEIMNLKLVILDHGHALSGTSSKHAQLEAYSLVTGSFSHEVLIQTQRYDQY